MTHVQVVVFYFNGRARDEDGSIKLCTVDGDAVDLEVEVIRPLELYGQGSTFVLLLDCCRSVRGLEHTGRGGAGWVVGTRAGVLLRAQIFFLKAFSEVHPKV